MVSRNFIKSIVYGFAMMFIAAGLLYGFTLLQKNMATSDSESSYIGTLTNIVDEMKKISIDEQNLIQRWHAETVDVGTALSGFADAKAKRQSMDDDFFSRSPPEKFSQIHVQLGDANKVYMEADDLYREGVFQDRDDYIADADARVVIAKEKMNFALSQLAALGYKL